MKTPDFDVSMERMRSMPAPPDWPTPVVREPMIFLPFGGGASPFWPTLDKDGNWRDEWLFYVQDRKFEEPMGGARVICIVASEIPELTQDRVDAACTKLAVGIGVMVDYATGDRLPMPGEE